MTQAKWILVVATAFASVLSPLAAALTVAPSSVHLRGKSARQQLLVSTAADSRLSDRTLDASYTSLNESVAVVDRKGVVTPVKSGTTEIVVRVDDRETRVPVIVESGDRFLDVTFERDVQPILTRGGCNSGACHGKQRGQNGFQLSLLGFDDDFDFDAIVRQARGRRIFPAVPERSLVLLKATATIPHGGGKRLTSGTREHDTLRRWMLGGLRRTTGGATPELERISVTPTTRLLTPRARQQIIVTAHFSDGTHEDVTHLAAFQSNESPIAAVDEHGLVRAGPLPGEAAIMARYEGKFATTTISIPLPGKPPPEIYADLPRRNFIDGHVWVKLERLGITPSEPCSDATFLRRVHIDIIGRVPSSDEVRDFLADTSPNKGERVVDRLLERPEYADHWSNKWVDLLRPNPYRVGIKAVRSLDSWVRGAFRENRPYDQFVRELVAARGSTFRYGATTVFRDRRSPDELVTMFSQLFLGIRLGCAKCHQHPFEVWSQADYYSLAAYFADVGRKGSGLSPPISGGEEFVFAKTGGSVKHPRTGETLAPKPLFGEAPPREAQGDLRDVLAEWLTSKENPFFARVIVNRVWADLMTRGIVEPVDDLRESNPPSNIALLETLAARFRDDGYDLKKLIRVITTSYVYGLSSRPGKRNVADTRNYSRHYRQRLRAEVLLDAVCDITGVPEKFSAMPAGSRAAELWTHRSKSTFLDTFGRPDPNQDPPCLRIDETTVVQALHLMNSPRLHEKVTRDGSRAAQLAASGREPREIVEELYLLVYSRLPTASESRDGAERIEKASTPREAVEDLLWALLNTPEFVFKD
jgi:hypothetical protein